jgi:hypothetical protein
MPIPPGGKLIEPSRGGRGARAGRCFQELDLASLSLLATVTTQWRSRTTRHCC